MNKPVIGGEFSLDPNLLIKEDSSRSVDLHLSTDFRNLALYASGRDAIYALVDYLKPQIVYLPDYICESIFQPFKHYGDLTIRHYRVREDLSVDDSFLKTIEENDMRILFVVLSYFGKVDEHLLTSLVDYRSRNERSRILLDITHSLFDKSLPSQLCHVDYSVCSLRKWFFLPDGGFLAGKELIPHPINDARVEFWSERTGAGLLRYFGTRIIDTDDDYDAMQLAETSLDNELEMGYRISSFSKIVLKKIDFEAMWITRKQNFEMISQYVGELGLKILAPDSSSFFTVAVVFDSKQKRDMIRAELKNKRIACPVHWDTSWMKRTHNLSELILSMPCDQRIGSEEIDWLKKILREVIDSA